MVRHGKPRTRITPFWCRASPTTTAGTTWTTCRSEPLTRFARRARLTSGPRRAAPRARRHRWPFRSDASCTRSALPTACPKATPSARSRLAVRRRRSPRDMLRFSHVARAPRKTIHPVYAPKELDRCFDLRRSCRDAFDITADDEALLPSKAADLGERLGRQVDGSGQHVFGRQQLPLHGTGNRDAEPFQKIQRLRRAAWTEGEEDGRRCSAFLLQANPQIAEQALGRRGAPHGLTDEEPAALLHFRPHASVFAAAGHVSFRDEHA